MKPVREQTGATTDRGFRAWWRRAVYSLFLLGCLTARLASAQVTVLPDPETGSVTAGALASDGARLVSFNCVPDITGPDWRRGVLKEWNGTAWVDLTGSGVHCHTPDVAISGDFIQMVTTDDSGNLQWKGNVDKYPEWNGWGPSTSLTSEKFPRAAFGLGAPFVSYVKFSGSDKIYVECETPYSAVCTGLQEVIGGYRYWGPFTPTDVGPASIAGDHAALYVAFASPWGPSPGGGEGCINVMKLTKPSLPDWWLGDCFSDGPGAASPQVAVVSGQPVVAWLEDSVYSHGYVRVARWDGAQWVSIHSVYAGRGNSFSWLRAEGSGSSLFLAYQSGGSIGVESWDGTTWSAWPNPVGPFSGRSVVLLDLAVYRGEPHLALAVDGVIKIVRLQTGGTTCSSFEVSPTSTSPGPTAGSQTVSVTGLPSGCQGGAWTASGNGSWLTVSPAGGTGSGSVTVSWTANASPSPRSGTATIAGRTFVVNQGGAIQQLMPLSQGRVQVTVDWQSQYSGQSGRAYAIPQADAFAFFYFFDPANPEVFVKVLDFGAGSFLCFVGGLTDFYYKVTFTVVRTGQTLVFEKPAGQYIGFVNNGTLKYSTATGAPTGSYTGTAGMTFVGALSADELGDAAAAATARAVSTERGRAPAAAPQSLAFSSGRVSVTVDWRSQYSGETGRAYGIPKADQYGFFYYSDPNNPEVFVKVLDFGSGGALCFVGSLTDFYFKVTFTVVRTGQQLVFEKPAGQYIGFVDNGTLKF